jgi:hypothetical protein
VRAPEQLHGVRIVATPAAIDAATAQVTRQGAIVVRIAPDDVLVIGVTHLQGDAVRLDDPHGIVEPESAFVGWWLTPDEVTARVSRHVEWQLPRPQAGRTQLAQGLVAGMPMKLWYSDPNQASGDGPQVLLMVSRGLAHEAQDRLFRTSSLEGPS